MKQDKNLFWLWLADRLGAENRDFSRLICAYSPYDLFRADSEELEHISGISEKTVVALSDKSLERAGAISNDCTELGISVIPYDADEYPGLLRGLRCPPVVLYCKGHLPDMNKKLCVGTVGTRRMSRYGMRVAYQLSYQLASAGVVVVSGMASGIDGVCAAGAMAAGGSTVAVVGAGIDVIYPKHHEPLMEEICKHGAVVSEYPPKTPAKGYQFPVRNRIISGMSQTTVVVEAGLSSGSLITAKDAILQGRTVFAFPSNVGNKGSEGTNSLLRDGVFLALSAADVLEGSLGSYGKEINLEQMREAPEINQEVLQALARLGVIELQSPAVYRCEENPTAPIPAKTRKKKTQNKAETNREEQPTEASIPSPKKTPDEVLASLSEDQRQVLEGIPDDRSVSLDELCGCGKTVGEVVAALTMLEIMGLVEPLPGGLYTKS